MGNESGYIYVYRAALDALGFFTLEAPRCLSLCHLRRISKGYLVEISPSDLRFLLRHLLSWCSFIHLFLPRQACIYVCRNYVNVTPQRGMS